MSDTPEVPRHFRVFVASPGDLAQEREAIFGVLQRLPYEPLLKGRVTVEVVAWDGPYFDVPMLATVDPQTAIAKGMPTPSECDIVLVVFWSRMGTPLPDRYQRPDGSTGVTGTEWEYLDAAESYARTGRPEVLVYRRTTPPQYPVTVPQATLDRARADFEAVEHFFAELKRGGRGFNSYEGPPEFAAMISKHLMATIRRLLDSPATLKDRIVLALENPARTVSVDDLVSFASDPLQEPHLRVMVIDRLLDATDWRTHPAKSLIDLAADLESEPQEPIGKAGVKLAEALIGSGLAGPELLIPAAANRRWEVKAAAIAATRMLDDPYVTKVYVAASNGLSYHVPINTMIARLSELRPRLDGSGFLDAQVTIENLLRNPRISEKVRASLTSARSQFGDEDVALAGSSAERTIAVTPENALRRIARNIISGTSNISPRDVRVVVGGGLVDDLVALSLSPDSAPVKQRQVAAVLVEDGFLDAALTVALAIKNRSEARTVGVHVLRRIATGSQDNAEWDFIRQLWGRLTVFQHRDLGDVIDELQLAVPDDVSALVEEARDEYSKR